MFLAEVIVGLASGAFGALGAPWLTHRLRRSSSLAEQRREPYRRLLVPANDLAKSVQRLPDIRERPEWLPSLRALLEALDAADVVSSRDVRKLTHDLWLAASNAHRANGQADDVLDAAFDDDPEEPNDELDTAFAHARQESAMATLAYERLRDQVQREMRG